MSKPVFCFETYWNFTRPFLFHLRYLLKKLLQLQALTEGEVQAVAPSHSSSLPLAYSVASTVGTIQGTGPIAGPSTGAEEPFAKKSKKERKEKGKENHKLEGTLVGEKSVVLVAHGLILKT